ncbi:MAG: hybrid sensor histidine kinase/response regulator, partial [Planctomycetaceae bacterium]|nr:hybrid sensor histidine kinase/response regulator [Planctomycetaceae bacterium]
NVPAELLEVFNEEADDHLKSLYRALEEIEKDEATRDLVQELRRAAHTLKGAAGAVGLRTITQIAHRMEDLLDRLYDEEIQPSDGQIKLIYRTTDTLQDLAAGTFDAVAIRQSVADLYVQYDQQLQSLETTESEAKTENESPEPTPVKPTPARQPVKPSPITSNSPSSRPKATASAELAHQGPGLRVPLERIDEVSRLVGELIINRSSLEQRMNSFRNFVDELQISLERLRKIAQELETHYEVEALAGRWDRGRSYSELKNESKNSRFQPLLPSAPGLQVSRNRLEEFDELEFDRYTEFHLLARSLSEVTNDVGTVGNELKTLTGDFDSLLTRQSRLAREAQDRLTRVRMVPLATIADRVKRTIRTVADQTGKNIQLTLEGEQVELDKNALEELVEPLMHLLRNAADHGIESPEEREHLAKSKEANVWIRAFPQGTQVLLEVADDGRGIDANTIRTKAVDLGMLTPEDAEALDEETCLQLIFEPGFSTAKEVTEVSGRGVGMDIVREKLRQLKGTISISSTVGEGTVFTIRLPMTQAITRALLVRVEKQIFAVPMQSVMQILRVNPQGVDRIGGEPVIQVAGETHPLHRMAGRLGIPSATEWDATDLQTMLPVVILGTGHSKMGFLIDSIIGARDIVVKTLGPHLIGKAKGLLGATLLGDGTVVPILDPLVLVGDEESELDVPANVRPGRARNHPGQNRPLNVLVADDSVSVRRVMTNLIKSVGWTPVPAKDGRDALEILHGLATPPDVFLLDIEMPRMDGYELLGFLRSQPAYRRTPVIMVTSRAGEKHRTKALDLGATGYMVKPYQDEALLSLIRELVSQPVPGSPARLLV